MSWLCNLWLAQEWGAEESCYPRLLSGEVQIQSEDDRSRSRYAQVLQHCVAVLRDERPFMLISPQKHCQKHFPAPRAA